MTTQRPFSHIIDRLRSVGLRPTRQRLALAKMLFDGPDRHVTAEKLHGESSANGVSVSLATVYNTLNQFTAAGLLREIVVDGDRSYFDTNISNHHHFYHTGSRQLTDIDGDDVVMEKLPSAPAGTSISRVDVIVRLENNT
jgi:Fur family transcriptional regulator, iron response regulator